LADRYHQLLKTGKLVAVGFNPIDLDIKLADVKLEKLAVEQALQRIQEGCIASAAQVYVSPNPVKPKRMMNVALAGTLSLCAGIALAFLLEYRRKD
jgi:capsular polysaccharide biosynthesis protein